MNIFIEVEHPLSQPGLWQILQEIARQHQNENHVNLIHKFGTSSSKVELVPLQQSDVETGVMNHLGEMRYHVSRNLSDYQNNVIDIAQRNSQYPDDCDQGTEEERVTRNKS